MYESHFGITGPPFQLSPDPNFYFGSKQHRRAKAYLDYGVLRNEGFIVITGEIGAGKTTLLRALIDGLHGTNVIVGHLVVPLILHVEMVYQPAYWIHAVLWLPLTLALSLLLIQPIKGMVIAMQWRVGMHGFEAAKKLRETAAAPARV